ncbi:MAG TPA: hypothetical protein PLP17_17575, partial [Oligoflexia bacterium]|nr:hypothetical protein [Oligoflexia bacterium]
MTPNIRNRVYFIAALVVVAAVILAPTFMKSSLPEGWPSRALRLGLDLRGGSYLILGVQTDEAVKSELNTVGNAVRSELKKEKLGVIRAKGRVEAPKAEEADASPDYLLE